MELHGFLHFYGLKFMVMTVITVMTAVILNVNFVIPFTFIAIALVQLNFHQL